MVMNCVIPAEGGGVDEKVELIADDTIDRAAVYTATIKMLNNVLETLT